MAASASVTSLRVHVRCAGSGGASAFAVLVLAAAWPALPLPQPRAAASAALITAFLGIFVILATRADDRGAGRAFAAGFLATLFAVPTMFVAWLGGGAVAGLFTGFIAAYMGAQIPFVRRKPPRGESEEHGDSRWADEIPAPRAA